MSSAYSCPIKDEFKIVQIIIFCLLFFLSFLVDEVYTVSWTMAFGYFTYCAGSYRPFCRMPVARYYRKGIFRKIEYIV